MVCSATSTTTQFHRVWAASHSATNEAQYAHFKAAMDGEGMSPLADFGSERNGHYDVVLVYNRPSITQMLQILRRLGLETARPIIIYMGRMVPTQRREWSAACRAERLTAMFVDELLLVFLASVRENRLEAAVGAESHGVGNATSQPEDSPKFSWGENRR